MASPGGTNGEEPVCQCRRRKRLGFDPWVGKIPWRREWLPTPVFLPGEFHEQRSQVGYSLWGCTESNFTITDSLVHCKTRVLIDAIEKNTISVSMCQVLISEGLSDQEV